MTTGEVFSKNRMKRCTQIVTAIMQAWKSTNSFQYVFRATTSLDGKYVSDLQAEYFDVGVGANIRTIPYIDMLVVMDSIAKETEALKARRELGGSFKIRYQVCTEFSDAEAARLLSSFEVLDLEGKPLRVVERRVPRSDEEDD